MPSREQARYKAPSSSRLAGCETRWWTICCGRTSLNVCRSRERVRTDRPDVRIFVGGGDGAHHLAHAGVGIDRLQQADGLGANPLARVMRQRIEHCIAHMLIFGDVGLEAF